MAASFHLIWISVWFPLIKLKWKLMKLKPAAIEFKPEMKQASQVWNKLNWISRSILNFNFINSIEFKAEFELNFINFWNWNGIDSGKWIMITVSLINQAANPIPELNKSISNNSFINEMNWIDLIPELAAWFG